MSLPNLKTSTQLHNQSSKQNINNTQKGENYLVKIYWITKCTKWNWLSFTPFLFPPKLRGKKKRRMNLQNRFQTSF